MTPKSIATNMAVVACDVCGRTLLRGEHADVFLAGGQRRTVCELCSARAAHEGWIREGLDDARVAPRPERGSRGRRLFGRRRGRADDGDVAEPDAADAPAAAYDPATYDPSFYDPGAVAAPAPESPAPAPAPPAAVAPPQPREVETSRERAERSVHAIPTNAELKIARALELFNASAHPRTVGGVARSLGAPIVTARPSATEGSIVTIVVGWELSWYRYEVDLADEAAGVRVTAQGTELDELEPGDRAPNAAADERGALHPAARVG